MVSPSYSRGRSLTNRTVPKTRAHHLRHRLTTTPSSRETLEAKGSASAGNRTRATRVAGEYSTTEPPTLVANHPLSGRRLLPVDSIVEIRREFTRRPSIWDCSSARLSFDMFALAASGGVRETVAPACDPPPPPPSRGFPSGPSCASPYRRPWLIGMCTRTVLTWHI